MPAHHPYVSESMRQAFWNDGVVLLAQVLEPTWMALVEQGLACNLRNPGPLLQHHYAGTSRSFLNDYCNYAAIPEYQMLLARSPVVDIVAAILCTDNLWLFYDQIFVKEAADGTARRTPWHQDATYWITAGSQQCGFWITLDGTSESESLEFVRGSHRGPIYAGTAFDPDDETMPYSSEYPTIPDIEADRGAHDIVSFPTAPGDVVMFHPAMLHGGGATASSGRRRTLSLRFFGDDVTYQPKARPSPKFPGTICEPGAPLRGPWFPQVYPRALPSPPMST